MTRNQRECAGGTERDAGESDCRHGSCPHRDMVCQAPIADQIFFAAAGSRGQRQRPGSTPYPMHDLIEE